MLRDGVTLLKTKSGTEQGTWKRDISVVFLGVKFNHNRIQYTWPALTFLAAKVKGALNFLNLTINREKFCL